MKDFPPNEKRPEDEIEKRAIEALEEQGWVFTPLHTEEAILKNWKIQLEKLNNDTYSEREFKEIKELIFEGNTFDIAKKLTEEDRFDLSRDDPENQKNYFSIFKRKNEWCQNICQVTNQVYAKGNDFRFDIILLINGLPLIQIELKQRKKPLSEAFFQINNYKENGAYNDIFKSILLFVISNQEGVNYFSHSKKLNFSQSFVWTDENNKKINTLEKFIQVFLNPCHISKMIKLYLVPKEGGDLLVLRPYQVYAIEGALKVIEGNVKDGTIWHTTGSGKTLTSFKLAQILSRTPEIDKVLFIVDRKDLDAQTQKEFEDFEENSAKSTKNKKDLVNKLVEDHQKIIITTIQKFNRVLISKDDLKRLEPIRHKKVVCIFDECHRSQFGESHKNIKEFFTNKQFIGFTGTPIFNENSGSDKRTTQELFGNVIHKYLIQNAINDRNVLPFSYEQIGKSSQKNKDSSIEDTLEETTETKKQLESPERLKSIVNYIKENHDKKTINKTFQAIFAVSSIDVLLQYYELFKKEAPELKVVTCFSSSKNSEKTDKNGVSSSMEGEASEPDKEKVEALQKCIDDYNLSYGTAFSTGMNVDAYYADIAKRLRNSGEAKDPNAKIDILLVVSMFLTGYDSKHLNTIYIDRNLRYHGLIQAYSRTNRILNSTKLEGNVVSFRDLDAENTKALKLFSSENEEEGVFSKTVEELLPLYEEAKEEFLSIIPNTDEWDNLMGEAIEEKAIKSFNKLLNLQNSLKTRMGVDEEVFLNDEEFQNHTAKVLNLKEKRKVREEESSLKNPQESWEDVIQYEMELYLSYKISVDHILSLAEKEKEKGIPVQARAEKAKKEAEKSPTLKKASHLFYNFILEEKKKEEFRSFILQEQEREIQKYSQENSLNLDILKEVLGKMKKREKSFLATLEQSQEENLFLEKLGILSRKKKKDKIEEWANHFTQTYKEIEESF